MVKSHRSIRTAVVGAVAVAAMVVAGCASASTGSPDDGGSSSADDITTVTLVYDWSGVDFRAVPVAVAKDRGILEEHGLDVDLILPPDDSTTVKLLGSNQGDIGFASTADVVITRGQGADVISLGNYSQENNWGLVARPGEQIDLNDLAGKKIGVFADNWTQAMMPFVLKAGNVTADDVNEVIFEGDDVAPLLADKLDLTTNTLNFAIAQVKEAVGEDPTVMMAKEFGAPDVPVWVYIAREAWLKDNADVARAFLASMKEAIAWSIDNPEDAVTIFEKVYPDNGSSHEYNLAGWQSTASVMNGPDGLLVQRDSQWSELTDALQAVGALDSAAEPGSYFTNEYLPAN